MTMNNSINGDVRGDNGIASLSRFATFHLPTFAAFLVGIVIMLAFREERSLRRIDTCSTATLCYRQETPARNSVIAAARTRTYAFMHFLLLRDVSAYRACIRKTTRTSAPGRRLAFVNRAYRVRNNVTTT